jgi:hypothetical protein
VDKDKVIELAKQAGLWSEYAGPIDRIKAFAQLIRDDYRADLLAESGEPVAWLLYRPDLPTQEIYDNEDDPDLVDAMTNDNEQPTLTPLYTADQLASAVEHWKSECRKLIRTYVVDDEAWNPEADTDKQMALRERSKA